jgi:hypothetical protein
MPITLKFSLQRIRLNSGGYDSAGRYYGIGAPVYHASADYETGEKTSLGYTIWETETHTFRAEDRTHAKQIVRAKFAAHYDVRFYN